MDSIYSNAIAELGVSLTSMAAKGAASLVYTKIKSSKNEKNIETIRNNYEEIILCVISNDVYSIMQSCYINYFISNL